jgi:hypothetical protein
VARGARGSDRGLARAIAPLDAGASAL